MKSFLALLALGFATPALAQPQFITVKGALAMKAQAMSGSFEGRAQMNALAFYLQGAVEGTVSYHRKLEDQHKPRLFCPQKGTKFSLTANDLFGMLEAVKDTRGDAPAAAVILERLAAQYPCKE